MFILQKPVELRNVSNEISALISKTADTGKYIRHKSPIFLYSFHLKHLLVPTNQS